MSLKFWHIGIFLGVYFGIALSVRFFPNVFIWLKVVAYMCIGFIGSVFYRIKEYIVKVACGLFGSRKLVARVSPRLAKGGSVSLPVDRYRYSEMDPKLIHDYYVKNSIPVVIQVDREELRESLVAYLKAVSPEGVAKDPTRASYRIHQTEPRVRKVIQGIVDKWHVGTVVHTGGSESEGVEMNTTYDYEADWVFQGKKRVQILPKGSHELLGLRLSGDRFRVGYSDWRERVPAHYDVELQANEILVYDVANCLRHEGGTAQSVRFHLLNFQSSSYAEDALRFLSSFSLTRHFRLL